MKALVKDLLRKEVTYAGPLIGLEIEVEGEDLPNQVKGWRVEHDGSLRGENREYVFPEPCTIEQAEVLLKQLNLAVLRSNATIKDTGYAGIHCHVNVGDLDWRALIRFASYWYVLEELLLRWSGETRTDNLFCMSLSAARHPLMYLREAIPAGNLRMLESDDIRYAALNWKALPQYGSLEFRSMRSTLERKDILTWCKILLELREQALIERPLDWIVANPSILGKAFVKELLPTMHAEIDHHADVEQCLIEGVRNIQCFLLSLEEEKVDRAWDSSLREAEKEAEHRAKIREALGEVKRGKPFPGAANAAVGFGEVFIERDLRVMANFGEFMAQRVPVPPPEFGDEPEEDL